ncbi:MAG: phosphoglycolate phosphatase [Hyphomicrobiaceae bacterium]|nr:phosphoglycolate phosphatase [Hyphomicrobiaceae bacterium]
MAWPRAILFDLDGTLVHSAPDITDALNILLEQEGIEPFAVEDVTKMIGGGVSLLLERALIAREEERGVDRMTDLFERYVELYVPRAARLTRLFPGVREVLEHHHGNDVALGVCTNKPEAVSRSILEALEVAHLFGAVVGGDTLPVKKPDPAPLLAALKDLACEPAHALMIGDSAADADAAKAAGMPVILVTFGYTRTPVHELESLGIVDHFDELHGMIVKLGESRLQS